MRLCTLVMLTVAALSARGASAQHANAPQQRTTIRAPREASQYDFLVGQWELSVKPKASGLGARIHGVPKLRGSWKAWRTLDGWGIEDELRIVDESGNPQSLTNHTRIYDMAAKRWEISSADAYRQQLTRSSAQWMGSEMVSAGEGTDGDGKAYRTRTRITKVTPTSFRYQQDRSYDQGKTWEENRLVIEAKRVAPIAPR